jgi:hypothetical protein
MTYSSMIIKDLLQKNIFIMSCFSVWLYQESSLNNICSFEENVWDWYKLKLLSELMGEKYEFKEMGKI